jgi:hypothetical protein
MSKTCKPSQKTLSILYTFTVLIVSLTEILQRPYKGLFIEVLSQYENGYRNTKLKKYQVKKKIKEFFLLMKLINVGFNIFGYE